MRYITMPDDQRGRQQIEFFWSACNENSDPRTVKEGQSLVKVLEKIEAVTDAIAAEIKCDACGHVLGRIAGLDRTERRTIAEGSGPRKLALEDAEYAIAKACLTSSKLQVPGQAERARVALMALLDAAPETDPDRVAEDRVAEKPTPA
jgi:hypothetical protein